MKTKEFIIGTRSQQEWGWLLILDLFFNGTGAGLFLIALMLGSLKHMLAGVALVFLATIFLFIELSKPANVWRIVLKPGRSWISRGAIGIFIFFAASFLYMAVLSMQGNGSAIDGTITFGSNHAWQMFMGVIAGCAAVYVAVYHGFLLASMKSVPLWSNRVLPALFLVYSLLGGLGVLMVFPFALEQQALLFSFFAKIWVGIMVFGLLMMLSFSSIKTITGKVGSLDSAPKNSLPVGHIALILATSIFIPIISMLYFQQVGGYLILFPLSGLSLLFGAFLLRYSIIKLAVQRSAV
ncbi:NrfD/PsrC family molybdoenzyme membrane anchor subunit [Desulfobacula sp.]|uniref:NrfD/PsrC family molybdoenzyme membrane anchor subunit n=1 Tax=Desulfobacula sp. TaxID=2593537 RepID=UPI002622B4FB|nr:NrfD/PsrC family molybdoenzyme membrane anchor subunit [Desulfobacula sp.]